MKQKIIDKVGKNVYEFIEKNINIETSNTLFVSTTNEFNIIHNSQTVNSIVNLSRVNDIRYINKFFISINNKLEVNNVFIGCVETFTSRRNRKKVNKIPVIGKIYFALEFIFMRVFPKVWGLKKIYFFITRGRNRLLSKAEVLGRLISCGFKINEYQTINGLLYFSVFKSKNYEELPKVSYGPLYKMPRMGKNGKIIGIYKFRTMHPYAEYLHDYILETNGYAESGKPADDFRLTPWGKIFRKYWIDELPQLINLVKGEIKLVGVRPISLRYYQDIPSELQELRKQHKPGCIPPYVIFNKASNVESVLQAEKKYMIKKMKNPYFTDTICFFMAIWHILIHKKRSA